jgi:hypothetical protein
LDKEPLPGAGLFDCITIDSGEGNPWTVSSEIASFIVFNNEIENFFKADFLS